MSVYNQIRQVINEWDPMHIIYDKTDIDEYKFEIRELEKFIRGKENISKEMLGSFILVYFNQQFGNHLRKDLKECITIAERILNNLYKE